jgi:hypothetical protein
MTSSYYVLLAHLPMPFPFHILPAAAAAAAAAAASCPEASPAAPCCSSRTLGCSTALLLLADPLLPHSWLTHCSPSLMTSQPYDLELNQLTNVPVAVHLVVSSCGNYGCWRGVIRLQHTSTL